MSGRAAEGAGQGDTGFGTRAMAPQPYTRRVAS